MRYILGREKIGDSLSRLTSGVIKPRGKLCSEAEEYVRFVAESSTPQALSTQEVERA